MLNPLQAAATLPIQPGVLPGPARFAAKQPETETAKPALGDRKPGIMPGADVLRGYNLQAPRFGVTSYRPLGMDTRDILLGDHGNNKEWDEWDKWKNKIWDAAVRPREGYQEDGESRGEGKGWLNPEDTVFVISDRVKLLQAAARSGYLSRYRHWSHGEQFQDLYNRQKYGFQKIYELVASGEPSHAFLLDENPTHAQKLVMAHVFGHTDFYRNNYRFAQSNSAKIAHRAGETHEVVENYRADPLLQRKAKRDGYNPVTKFLDNYLAVEHLIDMDQPEAPAITPYGQHGDKKLDLVGYDEVKPDDTTADGEERWSSWMDKFIQTDEEQEEQVNQLTDERERRTKDTPPEPTADVLGYIIGNSQALEPWQRDIMTRLRDESYFFSNLMQTKIMNEGWASFWHNKLLGMMPGSSTDKGIIEPKYMTQSSETAGGIEMPSRQSLNPYWLGVNMYKHIYERSGRGIPMDAKMDDYSQSEWNHLNEQDPDETKGIRAIQDVRRHEKDTTFIRKYLTQEFIDANDMYIYDGFQDYDQRTGGQIRRKVIITRDPERVKENIIEQYFNGGLPKIEVVNGDYGGNGQLLLKHAYIGRDINRNDALKTLKILQQLWGQPVHLDTLYSVDVDKEQLENVVRQLYQVRQNEKNGNPWPIQIWNPVTRQYKVITVKELEDMYFDILKGTRKVPIRFSTTDETQKNGYKKVKVYLVDEETGDVKKDRRGQPIEFNPRDFAPQAGQEELEEDFW